MKDLSNELLIDRAIEFAVKAHRGQVRKGTDIPYISHPYAVGMILLKSGCREEMVAAGILHDTLEDAGVTVEELQEVFGAEVAAMVEGCSEPEHDELSWEERKAHTLQYLKIAPIDIRTVACADKLHNLRTIMTEYNRLGNKVWERFKRGREKQEWYYRGLVESLGERNDSKEFEVVYRQFKTLVEKLFGKLK